MCKSRLIMQQMIKPATGDSRSGADVGGGAGDGSGSGQFF